MAKPNMYPENPHLPGTMLAAHWDLHRAIVDLWRPIEDRLIALLRKVA